MASNEATDSDEETRAFLQRRLSLVCAVMSLILAFISITNWGLWAAGMLPSQLQTDFPRVGFATVALAIVTAIFWHRCRTGGRIPRRILARMDVVAILVVAYTLLGATSFLPAGPDLALIQLLLVTYALIARAILIPSTGRTTLLVGVAVGIPVVLLGAHFRSHYPGAAQTTSYEKELLIVGRAMAITTLLSYMASRVIYGLRRRIHEAAKVGQYVLQEKIGQGGMGVVYRATHAMLRRHTAVKLLLPGKMGEGPLARFEREVTLTARLTHPNTVAIYDYGRTPEGIFYYAMEYLEGGDLDDLVTYAGPLPPGRAVFLLEQVCRALAEAHAAGLVHRDLKPANVLVCERGGEGDVAKVVDFGLVKDLHAVETAPKLTADLAIAGTPLYMAPESIAGAVNASPASDLYALGAVAFFLLTGEPVFSGGSIVEICAHHLHSTPQAPSLRRPGLSPALDAVVLRCLAKKPDERHRSVGELRAALLEAAAGARSPWTAADADDWWRIHGEPFRAHTAHRRAARLTATDQEVAQVDRQRRIGGGAAAR